MQLCVLGPKEYFSDSWNITDQFFHWSGIINIVFQFTFSPDDIKCTFSMVIVLLFAMTKTMSYLRTISRYTYLVMLLRSVISDLSSFMMLFITLVFFFSLMLGVMGYQNPSAVSDPTLKEELDSYVKADQDYPGREYRNVGYIFGNIIHTIRYSLGDNDLDGIRFLDPIQQRVFWLFWVIVIFLMCIIFLNFIIAEATSLYTAANE